MYKRELLKGNTETLLLSLLSEEAKYGYMLVKEIERRSGGYFQVKDGTVYPALHRLEKEQLVESKWGASSSGQNRRYYEITPKGVFMLKSLKEEWNKFCRALSQIMDSGKDDGASASGHNHGPIQGI